MKSRMGNPERTEEARKALAWYMMDLLIWGYADEPFEFKDTFGRASYVRANSVRESERSARTVVSS